AVLWLGVLAITSVTPLYSPPPADVTCAEGNEAETHAVAESMGESNCSESAPPIPAIIDCNDERASFWMSEMIGSSDMPALVVDRSLPGVMGGREGAAPQRVCNGFACSHESQPLRAAARASADGSLLVLMPFVFRHLLVASRVWSEVVFVGPQAEWPPRDRP